LNLEQTFDEFLCARGQQRPSDRSQLIGDLLLRQLPSGLVGGKPPIRAGIPRLHLHDNVTEFVRPHVELHHRVERLTNPDDVMIAFMLPRQLGRRRHLHAEIPFFKSHRKSRYAFRFTGDGFNFGFCGLDRFLRQPLREIAVEAPCPL
jgi:hypothetical protein